jgi:HEPN domain-containing protein
MPSKTELKKLARTRLKEAKVLYDKGFYDGACYLAGYVIELALKARICKILDLDQYPESGEISKSFKIHKLDDLLKLAGLQKKFDTAKVAQPNLLTNWSITTKWSENFRYLPVGNSPKITAKDTIEALEDNTDGVFTWITKYW